MFFYFVFKLAMSALYTRLVIQAVAELLNACWIVCRVVCIVHYTLLRVGFYVISPRLHFQAQEIP